MNKCLFCSKETLRPKYCSYLCVKRAWYLRNNPNTKSHLNSNQDFWKTQTGIGFKWEIEGAKLLGAEHLNSFSGGADLMWGEKLVDVKSCNLWKRKNKRGTPTKGEQHGVWVFNRNKIKPIDFFLCYCLKDDIPTKILLIPEKVFPKKGAVIGNISKYDKYKLCPSIPRLA